MASLVTSVGLSVVDGEKQSVYLDATVARRTDNLEIGLVDANVTGWFIAKADSGRRGTVWDMSTLDITLNRGSYDGDITIEYVYTDTNYDITNGTDRTLLENLWSAGMDLVTMQGVADQTGRYRYLRFVLTADGVSDPVVTTTAESQVITCGVEYAEQVLLSAQTDQAQRAVTIYRKSTPTIALFYCTTADGIGRFDLSTATITLSIAKSIRKAELDGEPLVGPLAVTIDDATHGEASIALTQAQTTLAAGDYIMQVELTKGAQILRHTINLEVLGTYL